MNITERSADWIKFVLHRIATSGCTGIKCRKCILRFRCTTRRPEDSRAVALGTIREMTRRAKEKSE